MTSRAFRSIAFKLHAWLGIHVFAILALLSITGTLLIYAHEIEALFIGNKRIEAPQPIADRVSFGTLFDQARAHGPGAVITKISRGASEGVADAAIVWHPERGERQLWFGGANGAVSTETGTYDFYLVLRELHDSFLTRTHIGGIFVTLFSVILTGFLITGLITYRRFWRGFFRWPSRAAGRRGYWGGVHRLAALWSLPFLALICLSGLFYLLDRVVALPYQSIDDAALVDRESHLPEGFDGAALDAAVAAAEAAIPGLDIAIVHIPGHTYEPLLFLGQTDTLLTGHEANRVMVDPTTLEVIGQIAADDLNAAHRVAEVSDQLHFGTFGGAVTEALWAAFGVLSTLLFFAGAMVYAARVSEPDGSGRAARIWSASALTKLGYPLMLIGFIAVAVLRFA